MRKSEKREGARAEPVPFAREIEAVRAEIRHSGRAIRADLAELLSPRRWTRQWPKAAVGASAVAGFAAGVGIQLSRGAAARRDQTASAGACRSAAAACTAKNSAAELAEARPRRQGWIDLATWALRVAKPAFTLWRLAASPHPEAAGRNGGEAGTA